MKERVTASKLVGLSGLGLAMWAHAITLLLCGCTTSSSLSKDEIARQQRLRRLGPQVEIVDHKPFNFRQACSTGNPQVEVRFANEVDLPNTPFPSNVSQGATSGAGMAGVGMLAVFLNPMLGQGAAVGGIILGPTLLVLGISNQIHANAIGSVLEEVDFPMAVQQATQKRLKERFGPRFQEECCVEVLILSYGLMDDGYTGNLSFIFDAELRVVVSDVTVHQDKLLMGPFYRNDDLPPPRRAPFWTFGDNEGSLTRLTLEEAVETIAAVIDGRLKGEP